MKSTFTIDMIKKRKNVFFLLLKSYLLQVNNVYSTFKKKKKVKIYF